ncbi:MAG: excinuclease ABC subunit UvrC, partial [Deltaproteobacteria bacterium]|nr:excinuclease ABC subunit UvrC [Deltaproteobacteria bacterium]
MALHTEIDALPTQPGVYLMKNKDTDVLYVGKAVDLRARVRQYFNKSGGDGRFHIEFLVPQISDVDVVVTRTEREALILEDTLIKKYQPRYNVKLKDDKSWLSVRLNTKETWPRVTTVRRWRDDGARYFGPYLDEVNAWEVVKLLKRTVPLRTCSDNVFRAHSERPCIEFQMGRCVAPCVGKVTEAEYEELVQEAALLLDGRNREVARKLERRMHGAAEELRFEEAARIRDSIQLIQRMAEKQTAQSAPGKKDTDVFALHREGELAAVAMLPVREGRLQDPRAFTFRGVAEDDGELLGRLITQLYSRTIVPPPEILTQVTIDEPVLRAELLEEIAERKVSIRVPQRGEGARLLDLAKRNASVRFSSAHSKQERAEQALFELQDRLHLPTLPRHIEAYDNSNMQGTDPVG